ncbi:MAG: hypothetical protein EON54_19210 [Alcaligenaceae bacterium]|nr:MAG: hypothetical protein EON54_19210 [Alcaligenaceae bacterium]
MEHSQIVQDAIERSLQLSNWIVERHPARFEHGDGNTLAIAFYAIALEHREAIVLLIGHGARTSAFALARSMYEANLKGSWARYCASEETLIRAFDQGILPGFDIMVRQLGKVPGSENVFRRSKDMAWSGLSDFAHGGMKQVIRWVGEEGIAPRHTDVEVCELLALMNSYALISAAGIVDLCGGDSAPHSAKHTEEMEAFKRWKGSAWRDGAA